MEIYGDPVHRWKKQLFALITFTDHRRSFLFNHTANLKGLATQKEMPITPHQAACFVLERQIPKMPPLRCCVLLDKGWVYGAC